MFDIFGDRYEECILQLPLHESSRHITTFTTEDGLYRFKKVPFGLASAPGAFHKLMTIIIGNIDGVQCYLDDIIIAGASQSEHDDRLTEVLKRINDAGFTINEEKSQISKKSLRFMGHVISAEGISPDPDKVAAIRQAPPLKNTQEVKSFLGLLSYYAKFIPSYSTLSDPLLRLTCKNVKWEWDIAALDAYTRLKSIVSEETTLSIFNPCSDIRTEIQTDASMSGLGAVLLQYDSNNEPHVIAFASRTLSEAERKYSTIEKEALAISFAALRWKIFLWGRNFEVVTDHKSLVSIFNKKDTFDVNFRIGRFLTNLLPFRFSIRYRKGSENSIADYLSRASMPNTPEDHILDTSEQENWTFNSLFTIGKISTQQFKNAVTADMESKLIFKWLNYAPLSFREKEVVAPFQAVKHELLPAMDLSIGDPIV